jgi:16S rRNA (guanine966-N2)-methyltransferase
MSMRVIAGKYRSRPLLPLSGAGLHDFDLRPTSDRLRETLFNVLTAGNPYALEGSVWLDLYAGTGAVGIEALSRGAAMVYFVESSARAADLVRRNLESLGMKAGFEILKRETARALGELEARDIAADFIFLDPPYRLEQAYEEGLRALARSPLATAKTLVVAEHQKNFDPGEGLDLLSRHRKLKQGDAVLSFYRRR